MGKSKKLTDDPVAELRDSFDRWDYIFEHGCSDPFWPDGVNLNLVHNHICYYKKQIEEIYPEGQRPEIFYRDTPPEVDSGYMARADEIRSKAKASLEVYKADDNFRYLKNHADALHPKDRQKIGVKNVIGYVTGLERAIAEDDLVTMRRHEYPERYLDSFESCADRVRAAIENPYQGQASLFSLICEQEDNDNYDESENCDSYEEYDDEEEYEEESYDLQ